MDDKNGSCSGSWNDSGAWIAYNYKPYNPEIWSVYGESSCFKDPGLIGHIFAAPYAIIRNWPLFHSNNGL